MQELGRLSGFLILNFLFLHKSSLDHLNLVNYILRIVFLASCLTFMFSDINKDHLFSFMVWPVSDDTPTHFKWWSVFNLYIQSLGPDYKFPFSMGTQWTISYGDKLLMMIMTTMTLIPSTDSFWAFKMRQAQDRHWGFSSGQKEQWCLWSSERDQKGQRTKIETMVDIKH